MTNKWRRLFWGALLVLTACNHSPVAPSDSCPVIPGHGSFCAIVDGVPWIASDLAPKTVPCVGTNPLTCALVPAALACQAFDSHGTSIVFLVNPTLGTQRFGSEGNFCCQEAVFGGANGSLYGAEQSGGSATVTITSLSDKNVVGTFSFVGLARPNSGAGQKTVTGGTFNVTNFSPCIGN